MYVTFCILSHFIYNSLRHSVLSSNLTWKVLKCDTLQYLDVKNAGDFWCTPPEDGNLVTETYLGVIKYIDH
jgi:hypothetical protein